MQTLFQQNKICSLLIFFFSSIVMLHPQVGLKWILWMIWNMAGLPILISSKRMSVTDFASFYLRHLGLFLPIWRRLQNICPTAFKTSTKVQHTKVIVYQKYYTTYKSAIFITTLPTPAFYAFFLRIFVKDKGGWRWGKITTTLKMQFWVKSPLI